jgi:hypothetical protein
MTVALLLSTVLVTASAPAVAADATAYEPGLIISDAIFFDSATMTASDIQVFLDQKGAGCTPGGDGTPCLKNYRQDTATREPTDRCPGGYAGAANESAATIIAKVAQACGVNPQVLLVTLQKEQSLVLASGSALYTNRYRSAMGYGCPDTAPCDALYYGFFNQVYSAASQFRNYALNPTRYAHRAGTTVNVRYHPNAACGTSPVYIQNQATAGLYNYTPYQPNGPALAAGYAASAGRDGQYGGPTDPDCASYGNRNFYLYFTDWFGPTTQRPPFGVVDSVTAGPASITVNGWALDPDTADPILVHMYVDGVDVAAARAENPRPDVGSVYGKGDRHGYSMTVPASSGQHRVCAYAVDTTGATAPELGCRTVTVVNKAPVGVIDKALAENGEVTVSGWAFDPDTTAPINVHFYIDGTWTGATTAASSRPDVAAVYGNGALHGYSATFPTTSGAHTVCAYGIDPVAQPNPQIACRSYTATVPGSPPHGVVDRVRVTGETISVVGWAFDPDTTDSIEVRAYLDGTRVSSILADLQRSDVGVVYGKGDLHGYGMSFTAAVGNHTVCVRAVDTAGGGETAIGCGSATVAPAFPNRPPVGVIDNATVALGQVTVTGWAFDPDTANPIRVHFYVDGEWTSWTTADRPRPDVGTVYGNGDLHGYSVTFPASPGGHTVCTYGIDPVAEPNPQLACRAFTVANPGQPVRGVVDWLRTAGTTVTTRGWAFDPETTTAVEVRAYVDGTRVSTATADSPRPDVAAAFGRVDDQHGYEWSFSVPPGNRSICVAAVDPVGGGETSLGCRLTTIVNTPPIGVIDWVTATGVQVTVSGWALDPDTTAPIGVHFLIDGVWTGATTAASSRPDVGTAYGKGDLHGYNATFPTTPGTHTICAYAIDPVAEPNPEIACRGYTAG